MRMALVDKDGSYGQGRGLLDEEGGYGYGRGFWIRMEVVSKDACHWIRMGSGDGRVDATNRLWIRKEVVDEKRGCG